jgi:hypothetical protein
MNGDSPGAGVEGIFPMYRMSVFLAVSNTLSSILACVGYPVWRTLATWIVFLRSNLAKAVASDFQWKRQAHLVGWRTSLACLSA